MVFETSIPGLNASQIISSQKRMRSLTSSSLEDHRHADGGDTAGFQRQAQGARCGEEGQAR